MGTEYIIRGGVQGRERLRLLSRVMRPTTMALLQRAGLREGMMCLDVGCGGGDVAFDMAARVGISGRVVGIDLDETKIGMAREEASERGLSNVEFRRADAMQNSLDSPFDFVHARFLLTHLSAPQEALSHMYRSLRTGGIITVEDIDFRGHFCEPDCDAFWRYVDFYTRTVARRGGDANIGPRLPGLLSGAGFENVRMNVVQPAGTSGEVKLLAAITMENIADAVVAEGFAPIEEVERVIAELYEFGMRAGTVMGLPRIVEAWGRREV